MDLNEVLKFYSSQNRILYIGGILGTLILFLGMYYNPLVFIGMGIVSITFIVCDIRETKFKNGLKNK